MTIQDTQRGWQVSRVRNSSEVRRWRPLVVGPSLLLGVDDAGDLLQFVERTDELIPADNENLLFFLPLLDMEYTAFVGGLASAEPPGSDLASRCGELVQAILALALRQRASPYIEGALKWLERLQPNDDIRKALAELVSSKRGTQGVRQTANRLLKRR